MKIVNVERLVDKLVKEFSETIDRNKMIYDDSLISYENVCNSCKIYIALFVIAFLIIAGTHSAYFYFPWYLKYVMLILTLLKQQFIKHVKGKY